MSLWGAVQRHSTVINTTTGIGTFICGLIMMVVGFVSNSSLEDRLARLESREMDEAKVRRVEPPTRQESRLLLQDVRELRRTAHLLQSATTDLMDVVRDVRDSADSVVWTTQHLEGGPACTLPP